MVPTLRKLFFSSLLISLILSSNNALAEFDRADAEAKLGEAVDSLHKARKEVINYYDLNIVSKALRELAIVKAQLANRRDKFFLVYSPAARSDLVRYDVYTDTNAYLGWVYTRSARPGRAYADQGILKLINRTRIQGDTKEAIEAHLNTHGDIGRLRRATGGNPAMDRTGSGELGKAYTQLVNLLKTFREANTETPDTVSSYAVQVLSENLDRVESIVGLSDPNISFTLDPQGPNSYRQDKWNLYRRGQAFGYVWQSQPGEWTSSMSLRKTFGFPKILPNVTTEDDVRTYVRENL